MAEQKNQPLTGRQKAAVLFIALGAESSALLFQHMNEEEIESVTLQIANQKKVPPDQKKAVITEFYQMLMAKSYLTGGGRMRRISWRRRSVQRRRSSSSTV